MGEIPTGNYPAGELCGDCFGVGKAFPPPAPLTVRAIFSGITVSDNYPTNPNGSYTLTQSDSPCHYFVQIPIPDWPPLLIGYYFAWGTPDNRIAAVSVVWQFYRVWFYGEGDPCKVDFANSEIWGGSAEIIWGP